MCTGGASGSVPSRCEIKKVLPPAVTAARWKASVNPSSSRSGKTQVSRVIVVALSLPRVKPCTEGIPVDQRVRERLLDFVAQPAIEAKVRRTLPRHVLRRGCDLLDKIAADQPALDRDREVRHQPFPFTGTSTKQPRISGGVCG